MTGDALTARSCCPSRHAAQADRTGGGSRAADRQICALVHELGALGEEQIGIGVGGRAMSG